MQLMRFLGTVPYIRSYKTTLNFSVSSSITFLSIRWNNISTDSLYIAAGRLIESGYFKNAINEIFDFVRNANKFKWCKFCGVPFTAALDT